MNMTSSLPDSSSLRSSFDSTSLHSLEEEEEEESIVEASVDIQAGHISTLASAAPTIVSKSGNILNTTNTIDGSSNNTNNLAFVFNTYNGNVTQTRQSTESIDNSFNVAAGSNSTLKAGKTIRARNYQREHHDVQTREDNKSPASPIARVRLERMTAEELRLPAYATKDIEVYMRANIKGDSGLGAENVIRLWAPYPDLALDRERQEKHCSLGDVGTFASDGSFNVMFNIFMSREDNIKMNYRPPPTFKPFELGHIEGSKRPRIQDTTYMSRNFSTSQRISNEQGDAQTRAITFFFKSVARPPSPGGAILVLPNGCSQHQVQDDLLYDIERHFDNQVASWYHLESDPSNKRRRPPNGSLKLIIGCYRANLWAAAALRSSKHEPDVCQAVLEHKGQPDWYEWVPQPGSNIYLNSPLYEEVGGILRTVAIEVCTISYEVEKTGFFSSSSFARNPSRVSLGSKMAGSISSRLSRISLPSAFSSRR